MTYTGSWAAPVPSVRQRTRSRAAGLVLKRSWRGRMLENLVLRRTVNPGTRITLYNSIRKTLELLRQVHLAKIITSWRFPSLVSWLLLLLFWSIFSWNFKWGEREERMSWTVSPCFLTLEDSWITRINSISMVIKQDSFQVLLPNPCSESRFQECPVSLSSEWKMSCLPLNASSVKFVVDFRCRVLDSRMDALSLMCLLILSMICIFGTMSHL